MQRNQTQWNESESRKSESKSILFLSASLRLRQKPNTIKRRLFSWKNVFNSEIFFASFSFCLKVENCFFFSSCTSQHNTNLISLDILSIILVNSLKLYLMLLFARKNWRKIWKCPRQICYERQMLLLALFEMISSFFLTENGKTKRKTIHIYYVCETGLRARWVMLLINVFRPWSEQALPPIPVNSLWMFSDVFEYSYNVKRVSHLENWIKKRVWTDQEGENLKY